MSVNGSALAKRQTRFGVAHHVERPCSIVDDMKKVIATGVARNVDLLRSNLLA